MAEILEKIDKRDLRRLELFCEIVEREGISNAAISTGLSQPVLSNQLIALEKSLGITLCHRGRSGFALTDAGKQVHKYANEINGVLSDFASRLTSLQDKLTGHVRIGCLDNTVTLPNNPIPKAIEAFYQRSDSVELSLEIGDYTQLNDKMLKNQLDILIVVLTEDETHEFEYIKPLFVETSFLYGRKDHVEQIAANNYSLDNTRINIGGYSTPTMHRLLNVHQYQGVKLIDGWQVESGLMLTMAGTHLSFLPTHLIDNSLYRNELLPLKPKEWCFESQFSIVSHKGFERLSPVVQAFCGCLTDAI